MYVGLYLSYIGISQHYLSQANAQLLDLVSYGATGLYVSPFQIKYLVYVYGLQALDHGVVRSSHKLFLSLGSVNTVFKTPLNGI